MHNRSLAFEVLHSDNTLPMQTPTTPSPALVSSSSTEPLLDRFCKCDVHSTLRHLKYKLEHLFQCLGGMNSFLSLHVSHYWEWPYWAKGLKHPALFQTLQLCCFFCLEQASNNLLVNGTLKNNHIRQQNPCNVFACMNMYGCKPQIAQ